jgi:predicted GIY-YIG superfamily endonuclease
VRVLVFPLAALSLGAFSYAWWMLDQNISVRWLHSTHVVYLLLNGDGEPLYIGSTDDLERRYGQHTSSRRQAADPWRRSIAAAVVLRSCRSERQARRVERRTVRAYTAASERGVCPPLNNDTWADPPPPHARPWRLLWAGVYRVLGRLHPDRCWDRPNPTPPWPVRDIEPDEPFEPFHGPVGRQVIDVDVIDDASSRVINARPAPVGGLPADDDGDDGLVAPREPSPPPFPARALPAASAQRPLRAPVSASGGQKRTEERKARQAANSRAYRARKRAAK